MKKELKGKIDQPTSKVGDFNTSLLVINGTNNKNSKEVDLNDANVQLELTNINRILNSMTVEYMLVSSAYQIVTKIDHIMKHKSNLNNIK